MVLLQVLTIIFLGLYYLCIIMRLLFDGVYQENDYFETRKDFLLSLIPFYVVGLLIYKGWRNLD